MNVALRIWPFGIHVGRDGDGDDVVVGDIVGWRVCAVVVVVVVVRRVGRLRRADESFPIFAVVFF
jgi:hypothetical protein